jgi:hypothetical protein
MAIANRTKDPSEQVQFRQLPTWLTFRRSWNTWADGKGISPTMRGALVGNSEVINSQVYTKTIADSLRNAVEVVSDELCANCATAPEMVN